MSDLTLSLWRSAPLDARLRFDSELLPSDDPLQSALKEAIGVVQLLRRGPELEAWAKAYPSLVVDTAASLSARSELDDEAHRVAIQLLDETRELLARSLHASGFEWIIPQPGEPPPADCRVGGEGPVVAACLNPGLRHRGALLLAAEVRLGECGPTLESAPQKASVPAMAPPSPVGASSVSPDWLRAFEQCAEAPSLSAVQELAARGSGADDALIAAAAEGLRCILGSEDQGGPLRSWLKEELHVELLEPREGEAFEATTMITVSERRTVHDHEADTVARLERVGFAREGRVLVPAEIVRYVAGEAW